MSVHITDGRWDRLGREARREAALHCQRDERSHVSAPKAETPAQAAARRQQLAQATGTTRTMWK